MRRATIGAVIMTMCLVLGQAHQARAQFTIDPDMPSYVPGSGPGFGYSGFGYGANGPRGYGYYTPLPDLSYYGGGGPSGYYSPIFNAMAAAPRRPEFDPQANDRTPEGNYLLPRSAPPPRTGPRRGFLRGLFGRH